MSVESVVRSSESAFLAPVSGLERRPLRLLAWLALSVVFTVLLLLVTLVPVAIVAPELVQVSAGALPESPTRLYAEINLLMVLALVLGLMALATVLAAAVAFRRNVVTFVAPLRRFDLGLALLGFVLFGVLVALGLGVAAFFIEEPLEPTIFNTDYVADSRWKYALAAIPLLLVAAAAEEVAVRGVLLQIIGAFTRRNLVLALITGLVFSAIHLDPDPGAFVSRFLAGVVWAWAVLRLGGLEFAIGAHLANNLVLTWFAEPFSEATQIGETYPLPYLAVDVVQIAIVFVVIEWLARRRAARTA